MKQWIIFILLILFILPIASAETCSDKLIVGKECTMLTPVLNCSGNYSIYNETLYNIRNGSMTSIGDNLYSFIFNESLGSYLIRLCDDSTREIIVGVDPDLIIATIVGLSIIGMFFFVLGIFVGGIGIKIFNFGVAFIQIMLIAYTLHLNALGISLSKILSLNLTIIILLGSMIGTVSLLLWAVKSIGWKENDLEEEDLKWQGKGKWDK